jgi:hypothetical protein
VGGEFLTYGNGSTEVLQAKGSMVLLNSASKSRKLVLQDVYYAPTAQYNVMSVRCASQKGAQFEFGTDQCHIFYGDELLLVAHVCRGVYVIDSEVADPALALFGSKKVPKTPELWHRGLGHTNLAKLTTMVDGINVTALR